jgi:UDP-N-acetylglucosamine 2-epimerase
MIMLLPLPLKDPHPPEKGHGYHRLTKPKRFHFIPPLENVKYGCLRKSKNLGDSSSILAEAREE